MALATLEEKEEVFDFLIILQRVIIFGYSTRNYITFSSLMIKASSG